jgi:hypothetical protein
MLEDRTIRHAKARSRKPPSCSCQPSGIAVTLDLTRSGGQPRIWMQSFREGSPHAEAGTVSRRTVALMPEAVAALRVHRKRQAEERLAAGSTWTERELIFPTRVDTPMSGTNLLKRSLRPLLSKAGLPPVTFHELRHTFATFHLASGERSKVIQEILGHSSIKTTMDTYSHVIPGMQEDAARRLSGLLFGPEPVMSPSNGEDREADDGEKKEKLSLLQGD